MKVTIIYPDINTIQFPHFQHGIAWVSAALKREGREVDLIYLDREWEDAELVEEIKRRDPDIVAFSSTTQQFVYARRYAEAIGKATGKFVIIGGIHATVDPDNVIGAGAFDALIRGEGEYPLIELCAAIEEGRDFTDVENLWTRTSSGEVIRNPVRPPLDVAELPWPDRELFDEDLLIKHNDGQVSVMASRGCPFRCTYCCNTVLSDLVGGNRYWVRQRPKDDIIAEIESLHQRFPEMKSLIFMDEVFTIKKKWVGEFCETYKKKFNTPFQVFLRIESVDREMMEWMKNAGLYSIIVGVESGNEKIRKEVLNRKMSNERIIQVFKWADELGLETWDFNMIGVPGDTEQTIRDTMELNKIIRPHHLQVSIFYPFPGTPLYDKCVEQGYAMVDESTSVFHSKPVLDLPTVSREKVLELHKEFVALGHRIEAEKTKKGYADLAARFGEAKVEAGGPGHVEMWRVRIEGEDRMAVLMHPPSQVTWKIKVEPRSILRFGMAFSTDVWDKPGKGATFEIRIKQRLKKEKTVFSEYIDPKNNLEHRKWNDREIDMSNYGGKTVEITLATSTPPGENQYCAAFWARPYLVASSPA